MYRLSLLQLLSLTLGACGGLSAGEGPLPSTVPEVVFVEDGDTDAVPSEELVLPAPTGVAATPAEPTVPAVPTATFELRRGETLAHYARWSGLPIEVVAGASGLAATDDQLQVGTVVRVPADEDLRALVEVRRQAHHTRRAEGYLDARGGAVGSEFYAVRTGDSATTIARDHAGIPVWLLETYNPSVDLERLRPGQELLLPVLADSVAEVPEAPEGSTMGSVLPE